MALTTAQTMTVFEILEVPYDGSVDEPMDEFNLLALTHDVSAAAQALQAKIMSRLTALTTDEETRLLTYVSKWESIDLNMVALSGGMGTVTGVEYDPGYAMKEIQRRVKNIIPVMRYLHEIQLGQNNQTGNRGGYMPVNR